MRASRTVGVDDARADAIVTTYEAALATTDTNEIWAALFSDIQMQVPADAMRDAHRAHGPTFSYLFTWPAVNPLLGACHGIDIPFTFGNFVDGWAEFVGADEAAHAVGRALRTAWATFARRQPRLGRCPATMVFGREPVVADDPLRARLASLAKERYQLVADPVVERPRRPAEARARRRETRRRARRARPPRRDARSTRRATGPSRSNAARLARRRAPVGAARSRDRRRLRSGPLTLGRERLRPGQPERVQPAARDRRAPPPPPRRCRADRSTRCGRRPSASRTGPCRSSPSWRASTEPKNDGCNTVAATDEAASRSSIARWLPCSPVVEPGIGMFEIFTMCSTPAASAAAIALVSSGNLIRRRVSSRGTSAARRRTRRAATPDHRGRRARSSTPSGIGALRRPGHRAPRRRATSHHAPPGHRARSTRRSRAQSRCESLNFRLRPPALERA